MSGYDYSQQGPYFVTILTRERQPFFEDPLLRRIAEETYLRLPEEYPGVKIDTWVVMPDHVHLLFSLSPRESWEAPSGRVVRAQLNCALTDNSLTDSALTDGALIDSAIETSPPLGRPHRVDRSRPTLGQVIRTYKALVTRRIHQAGEDTFLWHRNYYERVIRSDRELNAVREHILLNPEHPNVEADFDEAG
ncbi:MAG: transposase [Anaerolineales bacterium]